MSVAVYERTLETLHDQTVEVLGDLAPMLADEPLVQRTLDAVVRELVRCRASAEGFRDKLFATRADDEYRTLEMWEALLGLPVKPAGVSVEARRSKVLAYLRARRAGTGASWIELLTLALGTSTWTYFEGPADYTVTISIPYESGSFSAAQVMTLARAITPAHLDVIATYGSGFLIGVSQIGVEPL